MGDSIRFEYAKMYEFYRGHGDLLHEKHEAFATKYGKDDPSSEPSGSRRRFVGPKATTFVTKNMEVRRIDKAEKKLTGADYLLAVYSAEPDERKQLFIVTPAKHLGPDDKIIVTADHFSFPLNLVKNAKNKNSLHLHLTEYMPVEQKLDGKERGETHYWHGHLPPEFDLDELPAKLQAGELAGYTEFLQEMMARPWKTEPQNAGGQRARQARQTRRPERIECPKTFEELFTHLPIEEIMTIAIYNRDTDVFDVTVFVRDIYDSLVTRGLMVHASTNEGVIFEIERHFKKYDWNTFPVKLDDEYDYDSDFHVDNDPDASPEVAVPPELPDDQDV